jgi:hypothetical protein
VETLVSALTGLYGCYWLLRLLMNGEGLKIRRKNEAVVGALILNYHMKN